MKIFVETHRNGVRTIMHTEPPRETITDKSIILFWFKMLYLWYRRNKTGKWDG